MVSRLVLFVSLFSLSAAGMVMSAATPSRSTAAGSCCAGCPLCGDDCACQCASGCQCCSGGACTCDDCACPCCSASAATSASKSRVCSVKSGCSQSGKCCSVAASLFELSTTSDVVESLFADASRPVNLAGGCCDGCPLCGDDCTCDCPVGCACCTGGGCICDDCRCPCCAAK